MRRLVVFLIALAAVIAVSVWLADHPGSITVLWLGWRLDTGVPIFLLAVGLVVAVILLLLRLLRGLGGVGRAFGARLDQRRVNSGLTALTRGFAALQAGDVRSAARLAGTASEKLKQDAASRLLTAEAARLGGNAQAAREQFERLLAETGMDLAALRGLSQLADAEHNPEGGLQWARRALDLEPGLEWARVRVLEGLIASRQWDEALKAIQAARRAGALDEAESHRRCAAVLTAQAEEALSKGQAGQAVKLTRKALSEHDPRSRAAVLLLVRALQADGAPKKAAEAAISHWRTLPHPDLAAAYMAVYGDDPALKQVAHAEKLAEANPEHPESRLLVARAALKAQLWGQARSRLKPLVEGEAPNRQACVLMAEIEDSETQDLAASLRWMRLATAGA